MRTSIACSFAPLGPSGRAPCAADLGSILFIELFRTIRRGAGAPSLSLSQWADAIAQPPSLPCHRRSLLCAPTRGCEGLGGAILQRRQGARPQSPASGLRQCRYRHAPLLRPPRLV